VTEQRVPDWLASAWVPQSHGAVITGAGQNTPAVNVAESNDPDPFRMAFQSEMRHDATHSRPNQSLIKFVSPNAKTGGRDGSNQSARATVLPIAGEFRASLHRRYNGGG